MIESEKAIEEITKKINSANSSELLKTIVDKTTGLYSLLQKLPNSEGLQYWSDEIQNSAHQKLNEHDMLQANQANLKCSSSYASNIKQVINTNPTLYERYHKLQKISLHHILSKGNERSLLCWNSTLQFILVAVSRSERCFRHIQVEDCEC